MEWKEIEWHRKARYFIMEDSIIFSLLMLGIFTGIIPILIILTCFKFVGMVFSLGKQIITTDYTSMSESERKKDLLNKLENVDVDEPLDRIIKRMKIKNENMLKKKFPNEYAAWKRKNGGRNVLPL